MLYGQCRDRLSHISCILLAIHLVTYIFIFAFLKMNELEFLYIYTIYTKIFTHIYIQKYRFFKSKFLNICFKPMVRS